MRLGNPSGTTQNLMDVQTSRSIQEFLEDNFSAYFFFKKKK